MANVVDGIPKRDAAKQLGISERTLDRKLYDLQIECKQIAVPGRRPLVVIPTADFERVKAAFIPVEAAPATEESTAIVPRPTRSAQELVALLKSSLQAPPLPLFLDLKAESINRSGEGKTPELEKPQDNGCQTAAVSAAPPGC